MSIPYHLTRSQSHPLLYQLSDGRFQTMQKGDLTPLMVGSDYVIVERDFAQYLATLAIPHLQIVDAVIYEPRGQTEDRNFKQLLIDLHFEPGEMADIDTSRDLFLLMSGTHLFVTLSLKTRLEASQFKYFEFSYGLSNFVAQRYISKLKSVDELRLWNVEQSYIDKVEQRTRHRALAPNVTNRIRAAFAGVSLGDGIGLRQAQAIDDYESEAVCLRARETDENEDWSRISINDLNACQSSLSFFDAEGMRFHLPAYLIADLEGKYSHDLDFYLTNLDDYAVSRFSLLSSIQRTAIREYLQYIADDEDNEFNRQAILRAVKEYWTK